MALSKLHRWLLVFQSPCLGRDRVLNCSRIAAIRNSTRRRLWVSSVRCALRDGLGIALILPTDRLGIGEHLLVEHPGGTHEVDMSLTQPDSVGIPPRHLACLLM
jgi:hypothetical protein